MLRPLALVVAMSRNRVIGVDGGLPWHIPEDLKHFRRVTLGHAIVMGRKTWDSIGRPLPKRRNLVVTRQEDLALGGAEVFHSLEAAIEAARRDDEPRIVGGATLYEQALPKATRLLITEVDRVVEGDVLFPALDPEHWVEVERRRGEHPELLFRTLERRLGEEG